MFRKHPHPRRHGRAKPSNSLESGRQLPFPSSLHGISLFRNKKSQLTEPPLDDLRSCPKVQRKLKSKRFQNRDVYFRHDLETCMNFDTVSNLLKCQCTNCDAGRKLMNITSFEESRAGDILGQTSKPLKERRTYIVILSLLLHVDMVPFIYEFLKRDLSDDVLEADLSLLSPQHLMEKVFRKQKLNTEQRSTLEWQVGKVDRCKNEFFPRRLTREYEVFPPEACFPFLKEIPIDDGRVSELWIDQEYVSFEVSMGK